MSVCVCVCVCVCGWVGGLPVGCGYVVCVRVGRRAWWRAVIQDHMGSDNGIEVHAGESCHIGSGI